MIRPPERRGAVSLVEVIVALAILAVAGGAMLTMSSGESVGVAQTEERYVAELLLGELEAAYGEGSLEAFQATGFPPPPAGEAPPPLDPLIEAMLEDDQAITGAEPPLDRPETPVGAALRATMERMQVTRGVYLEELVTGEGLRCGRVTLRVGYRNRDGQPRVVESRRVVYPAGAGGAG